VCYALNLLDRATLGWIPPLHSLTAQTHDTLAFNMFIIRAHLLCSSGENATAHVGDKVFHVSNFDTTRLDDPNVTRHMQTIECKDFIGSTFLKETVADGQGFIAKIFGAVVDKDSDLQKDQQYT
jgi:hypothetical protein